MSPAPDLWASGGGGDHETEAHPDPTEQDWPGQGEPGQGAVRADPGLCQRWVRGNPTSLCFSFVSGKELPKTTITLT